MSLLRSLFFAFCLAACTLAGASSHPNIILITLDTVRADRMGFLGSERGLTPNLDALAQQSAVFTRAYSQVPLTPPSHATILTGTYPQFHKVDGFDVPLAKDLPYAPELLRANGYRTAAFVGSFALDPQQRFAQGFDRGFDTYDAGFTIWRPGLDRYHTTERRAGEVVARALTWLDKHPGGPFFMWVHLYDAHRPYDPPEPYKAKYAAAPYDGEIAYADSAVGELLKQLRNRKLYDGAIIAVTADHGEALGEHGEDEHGIFLYDETIHVPLLIKLPRIPTAANRPPQPPIESRVELVDVLPTILQSAGIAIPKEVQGQSLLELMDKTKSSSSHDSAENNAAGSPAFHDRPAYSETDYPHTAYGWSPLRSFRTGNYLFIDAPKPELYDESTDPNATHNLFSKSSAVSETLAAQLHAFRQKTGSSREAPRQGLDPQAQEALAALGYIATGSNDMKTGDKAPLADPKDKIEIANMLAEITFLTSNFQFQQAVALLQQVIAKEPGMPLPYGQLGRAYISLNEYAKAVPVLRKLTELTPDSITPHFYLGVALMGADDSAAAIPEFETVVNKGLPWDQARFMLAKAYSQEGRSREAITECEKVIESNANDYGALLLEGKLLALAKQPEAALPKLERAAALQPQMPEPRAYLASAFTQLGRTKEAARERAAAQRLEANRDVQVRTGAH
jgi:arylsulfatase A-like enzyme/Flp pilus assembly protein TadD